MARPLTLVLASQSPRRKELLSLTGYPFETVCADIDETFDPRLTAVENVMEISVRKAEASLALVADPGTTVLLSADTTVVLDGIPLGKPVDATDAFSMLSNLQGRTHEVLTGFTVMHDGQHVTGHAGTLVEFEPMADAVIRHYIQAMKPFDKAGSYGIQDPILACYVRGIQGCYYNVVGLPVSKVCSALRQFLPAHA
ncbi:MAG: septum formation protein Maf [Chlorobiaceae bacterium]|nr:septum formation protein Maf [Chlorobiaceae bacterium]